MLPVLVALALTPAADPTDDLARVLAGWERRRASLRTARFEVQWNRDGQPPVGKPVSLGMMYPTDGTATVLLDVADTRFRHDEDCRYGYYHPRVAAATYRWITSDRLVTGRAWRHMQVEARPVPVDPSTSVALHTITWPVHRHSDTALPLFWATGRLLRIHEDMKVQTSFGWVPEVGRYTVAGSEVIDGRRCLILTDSTSRDTWAVDPERDGAVIRKRLPIRAGEYTDWVVRYEETPHGWLPTGWTRSVSIPGQPTDTGLHYRVTQLAVNQPLPASEFEPDLAPGQPITIDDIPHTVRPDGQFEMDPVYAQAIRREEFKARMLAMLRDPRTWVLVGLLALLFIVAVAWRILRSRRDEPAAD